MQESFVVKLLLLNIDQFECFTVRVVGKEGYFFMLTHLNHGGIYLVFGWYNIEAFELLLIIFKWKEITLFGHDKVAFAFYCKKLLLIGGHKASGNVKAKWLLFN